MSEKASNVEQPKAGTIAKLLRGEYSLAKTFWGYGILGLMVFNLLAQQLIRIHSQLKFVLTGLFIIYMGIITVSIWRSAKNYQGRAVWSWLARAMSATLAIYIVIFLWFAILALIKINLGG